MQRSIGHLRYEHIYPPEQPFSTAEVKQLMVQLLSAIEHLHDRWYIHRDLKTSNLLYSNKGILSVCDFGMARKYGTPSLRLLVNISCYHLLALLGSPLGAYSQPVITLYYRPPELLLGERIYSTSVDMWGVGCIFAEFLLRKPLFPGSLFNKNNQLVLNSQIIVIHRSRGVRSDQHHLQNYGSAERIDLAWVLFSTSCR